jgi:hypothetical protein
MAAGGIDRWHAGYWGDELTYSHLLVFFKVARVREFCLNEQVRF